MVSKRRSRTVVGHRQPNHRREEVRPKRAKWFEQGLVGLYGEARSGRPRTYDEERVAGLLRTVLQKKPTEGTHWTVRSAAAETSLSKSTVARMLSLFGVQPHRSKSLDRNQRRHPRKGRALM
jgi:hypothetical protein